ncbi:MAG TPA: hypothetical protein VH439_12590 [Gemmatimonadales bacterium]
MTSSRTPRPLFDSYALPLTKRRQGAAAALSFAVHVTIAILVLWRGAVLFEGGGGGGSGPRGGGGGGGRPALSWVALPIPELAHAEAVHPTPPPPAVTVPTVAAPLTEPVKIEVPHSPPVLATTPPVVVGTGDGTTGGPGAGPGSGGGTGTGTGTGAGSDVGPGSGGKAGDIFGPTPLLMPLTPAGAPPEDKRRHEVRFFVRADGHVARIDVIPPIKDSRYRRMFMEAMQGYEFSPAKTRDGHPIDYVYSIVVIP